MRSYLDDARVAIAAMGPLASAYGTAATTLRFWNWLGRPSRMAEGTSLQVEGPIPGKITVADELVLTANLMEHADLEHLLGRLLNGPEIPYSPATSLLFRNAPTLGAMLEVFEHIGPAGGPHHSYTYKREGNFFTFEFRPAAPLGRLADFIGLIHVATQYRAYLKFAFERVRELTIELTQPENDLVEFLRASFQCEVRFGQPINRLIFPSSWAEIRNDDSDEALWLLAKERLEALIAAVHEGLTIAEIREQVYKSLCESRRVPRLEEVAEKEGVSTRTLSRMVASHGTKFQTLVAQERRKLATELLNDSSLGLVDVANALGFANLSSFDRAFHEWFNMSPRAFRKAPKKGATKQGYLPPT